MHGADTSRQALSRFAPDFQVLSRASASPNLDIDKSPIRAAHSLWVALVRTSHHWSTPQNDRCLRYVKPLFTDVKVYDSQKDAKKTILHQPYELAIGGAAKLLKNRSTQQVATKVDISGPVNTPNLSTWQAIGQFLANAFVNAIVPGFDREVAQARQAHS